MLERERGRERESRGNERECGRTRERMWKRTENVHTDLDLSLIVYSISQKWLPRFAHNVKNISQNACVAGKMSKRSIANQTSNARPADQRFAQAEMSKCFQQ